MTQTSPLPPDAAPKALATKPVVMPLPELRSLFIGQMNFQFSPQPTDTQSIIEDVGMAVVVDGNQASPLRRVVMVTIDLDREKNPTSPYDFSITAVAIIEFEDTSLDEVSLGKHAGLLIAPSLIGVIREQLLNLTARCDAPKIILPLYGMSTVRELISVLPLKPPPERNGLGTE